VAGFDDRRLAIAILPACLEQDLLGLPDEAQDDDIAGRAVLDRFDGSRLRWEGKQGQDLSEVLAQFLAEFLDRAIDVAGDQRRAERLGMSSNVFFIHGLASATVGRKWRPERRYRGGMVKVLLIDPALGTLLDGFAERLPDVEIAIVADFSADEFQRQAVGATILVNARRPIDAELLAMAPETRLIHQIGVGIDAIDQAAIANTGIIVAYNPGVNRTGAAEHMIMLMLALIKRLPQSEAASRAGRFVPADIIPIGIDDMADATVGLIGMGQIGQAIVDRLLPFGSTIVYHARHAVPAVEDLGVRRVPLDELLSSSTIVSLHIPLTPETHHLIGEREIASMRPGSYLINGGRGGLVDEAALREAIVSGHLGGAALDVLERETAGVNPFADLDGVIVTPHLAGGSRNSMAGVVDRCTSNIERFLAGEPLRDVVT
jgi:phosphoglycerate dehydrogenase-like enzyme